MGRLKMCSFIPIITCTIQQVSKVNETDVGKKVPDNILVRDLVLSVRYEIAIPLRNNLELKIYDAQNCPLLCLF